MIGKLNFDFSRLRRDGLVKLKDSAFAGQLSHWRHLQGQHKTSKDNRKLVQDNH